MNAPRKQVCDEQSVSRRAFAKEAFVLGCGVSGSLTLNDSHAAETLDGTSWTQFRGSLGNGLARSAAKPPTEWSAGGGYRWRTPLEGEGWSSPVIDRGNAYVTAALKTAKDSFRLVVHKLDFESGRLLKTFQVFRQGTDRTFPIHSKNSHASPTLIIDNDRLFVHFGYQGTACITTSGEIVWENRDLVFPPVHGNGGSPILFDRQLIFTCDGADEATVASLDRDSGEMLWRTPRPVDAERKFSFATPAAFQIDDQTQIIAPGSDCVVGLSPSDGRLLWTFESPGFSVVPKPMMSNGLLVYCTGFMRPSLIALKPGTAKNDWVASEQWRVERNVPKTPTPIVDEDGIVMISDEGILTRVNVEDGSINYRERLGGKFSASPIKVNDVIYLTNEEGTTTVVQAGSAFQTLAENRIGERTFATPAFAEDSLVLRSEKAMYRIG